MTRRSLSKRLILIAPFAWMAILFLAPLAIVIKISLSQSAIAQPPYTPVFTWPMTLAELRAALAELSLAAYASLADDALYIDSYLSSLRLASLATLLTLAVAYPMAFAMARAPRRLQPALVMLSVAPFWTSSLIRVYAWIAILKDEGLLNHALLALGVIREPLSLLGTDWAVLIGIAYSYLPFMVLPLYNAIARQDPALLEAAADLGAGPVQQFWRVTAPLSAGGVIAGCLMVFIPAVGEFVIPDLLGGSDTLMIGHTMWTEFFDNRDWPTASAATIVLLALLLAPLVFYDRARVAETRGAPGGVL
jgi:putrescine transport system permease protein